MNAPRIAAALLLLVSAGIVQGSGPTVPEPVIPPGYQPVLSKDEQGLWLQMEDYERQLQHSPLLVRDEALNAYVKAVACRVAGPYCRDVRIYLVRNAGFNASMAPNGMMQVWTGLLTRVRSEDELATILGHEIAHYTLGHTIQQWRSLKTGMTAGQILSLGIGVATGVLVPVGESLALLHAMAFSREQEGEADLLGAQFMAKAGLDPHAASTVWGMLIAEERHASDKGDEPAALLRTHPQSDERAAVLRQWAVTEYGPPVAHGPDASYLQVFTGRYQMLMDDQIDTNRYSRTEVLLERHAALGIDTALIAYYRGEMYRQRAAEGDAVLARDAYLACIATGRPVPDAYRNLGYLYMKTGDKVTAREYFRKYLESAPEADDRDMIEFFLEDEGPP